MRTTQKQAPLTPLKAPYPFFGGKSRVADQVWARFGDVEHYIEPFAGSLAVLLARRSLPHMETVNDADNLIVNFWRAAQRHPDGVVEHADWPVTEADLHARHLWLVNEGRAIAARCYHDPLFFDERVAGWWLWGVCAWIGGWFGVAQGEFVPPLDVEGIPAYKHKVWRILPCLTRYGQGIHRKLDVPDAGEATFADMATERRRYLFETMRALCDRLRHVRITCGEWDRVLGPGGLHAESVGVLLDPPYDTDEADCKQGIYAGGGGGVAAAVREWAIAHGDDPKLRIALCGYAGEHAMPDDWVEVAWKAAGGYGNRTKGGRGRANANRERVWFSPHCLKPDTPRQASLLEALAQKEPS